MQKASVPAGTQAKAQPSSLKAHTHEVTFVCEGQKQHFLKSFEMDFNPLKPGFSYI